MFFNMDPQKDEIFSLLGDGKQNPAGMNNFTDEEMITLYKEMLFARTADLMAVSYQRQGRMYTYPPNLGQEAIAVASGMVLREEDWLVPAFREMGAWLKKGATLKDLFLIFRGDEWGNNFKGAPRLLPISVPIASQLLHAVGIGYALKYKNEQACVFAYVGDGGTSEGDFHEALNFAAVWGVPVVFVVQNNQFAISVPFKKQTASTNIAVKAIAYGMEGLKVDGNDIFAMYAALQKAREYAVTKGPVLLEAVTYRQGAHTTSDDPSKYRTKEEEKEWEAKDPLQRLHTYLEQKELLADFSEEKLIDEYKAKIDVDFREAEETGAYKVDDVFDYMYADMPDELKRQKNNYLRFLKWKEGAK